MTSQITSQKRNLGAFYTPLPVAQKLVEWALAPEVGPVLDPSFGGCSFLRAAADHLNDRGLVRTNNHVYGVDIDPGARRYLRLLNAKGRRRATARIGDYFSFNPATLPGAPFAAIVGNPPYLRHHAFGGAQRAQARSVTHSPAIGLPSTANAWAYFTVHSMSMLRRGGRMAFLLPGAALHADYARPVVRALEQGFSSVTLVYVRERIFDDTDQDSVLLLAAGHRGGPCSAQYAEVATVQDLRSSLADGVSTRLFADGSDLKRSQSHFAHEIADRLAGQNLTRALGDLARVRIGIVTGANAFFLRSPSEMHRFRGRGIQGIPIISRSAQLRGPYWALAQQQTLDRSEAPSRLLCIHPEAQLTPELKREVRVAEASGLATRLKCRRRLPWYSIDDVEVPEAFIRYMSGTGFWIVSNRSRSTSTNAVHRLWWNHKRLPIASIVVGSWTTFFQLEAEVAGRSYGGGVLKVEPTACQKLRVPITPSAGRCIGALARLVAQGRLADAHRLADQVVLREALKLSDAEIGELRLGVEGLRRRRVGATRND